MTDEYIPQSPAMNFNAQQWLGLTNTPILSDFSNNILYAFLISIQFSNCNIKYCKRSDQNIAKQLISKHFQICYSVGENIFYAVCAKEE
jgi:hypothetical protein